MQVGVVLLVDRVKEHEWGVGLDWLLVGAGLGVARIHSSTRCGSF